MEDLKKIFSTYPLSHHAYGIESTERIGGQIASVFEKDTIAYVHYHYYKNFGIDDARTIRNLQSEKTEKMFIFILEFSVIHYEAQNALLKILEEPSAHTHFILIFPRISALLPTLRSRIEHIPFQSSFEKNENTIINPEEFYSLSLQERFDFIKKLTDKKEESFFNIGEYLIFLDRLERYLYQQIKNPKQQMQALWRARSFADKKGASLKMALEYLAMHV